MKKFSALILLILVCSSIFSQNNSNSIGIICGPSLVSLRGYEIFNDFHQQRFTYTVGLFYKLNI